MPSGFANQVLDRNDWRRCRRSLRSQGRPLPGAGCSSRGGALHTRESSADRSRLRFSSSISAGGKCCKCDQNKSSTSRGHSPSKSAGIAGSLQEGVCAPGEGLVPIRAHDAMARLSRLVCPWRAAFAVLQAQVPGRTPGLSLFSTRFFAAAAQGSRSTMGVRRCRAVTPAGAREPPGPGPIALPGQWHRRAYPPTPHSYRFRFPIIAVSGGDRGLHAHSACAEHERGRQAQDYVRPDRHPWYWSPLLQHLLQEGRD